MAEFCIDCWNKINETNEPESNYIISDELELCEGCGKYKKVIVAERKNYQPKWYRRFLLRLKHLFA